MHYVTDSPARLDALKALLRPLGWEDAEATPLASDCSFRRYLRVRKGVETRIVMDSPPELCESVAPFLFVDEILIGLQLKAPQIYAFDETLGLIVMEDMGRDSFSAVLAERPSEEARLYDCAVSALEHVERYAAPAGLKEYGAELLRTEAHLPMRWHFPFAIGEEKAGRMYEEYAAIWERLFPLMEPDSPVLVHRDYHADNLMWLQGKSGAQRVGMLDFQDAVIGHAAYDLASLLEDVRRVVSDSVVESALARKTARMSAGEKERFFRDYALYSAQRNCKILGIFGRMSKLYGKPAYMRFLPDTWRVLEKALRHEALRDLKTLLEAHFPPSVRRATAFGFGS
ncbi:MAG: phosphotransferase [Rickettsiales bacterium]